jgi:hypothetical protein
VPTKVAVKSVSMCIPRGEVFGLLVRDKYNAISRNCTQFYAISHNLVSTTTLMFLDKVYIITGVIFLISPGCERRGQDDALEDGERA